jgi:hypothetical protein
MRYQFRVKTLLGLVLGMAVLLACYVRYTHVAPWERSGGMIGWSQADIESRLGLPAQVVEGDGRDREAQQIGPKPPGTYRTLFFSHLDGQFVVLLKAENDGFVCFRSSWTDKRRYY